NLQGPCHISHILPGLTAQQVAETTRSSLTDDPEHQLPIMKRSQRRSPNLTSWDRLLLGFYTLLVSPKRLRRIAVIPKASTLVRLHQALVKRKYHLLYTSQRRRRPGPKGPSSALIAAVVEMKR